MAELSFTVDSALLSELGEKLVETAHIALVELVKNAYDADATLVTVKIVPDADHGPQVHVIDNGSGMTFRDVENYWMRIATTHKNTEGLSPRYGRPRTGSKGIGRFSCRRLGTKLALSTTASIKDGRFERTDVSFDWLKFKPGTELTTIHCEGERQTTREATTGTTLTISGSPFDEWTKRGYQFLKRQLAVLAANRGRKRARFEEDPGFNVRLEAPNFSEDISNLRDRLLKAGWGDLKIRIDAEGEVTCTLDALTVGEKTIIYPKKYPSLAGVTASIGIMPNDRPDMRNREIISKSSLSEILDQWGGVYVRYKGFRVYPYGELGNDWLNIERDRGARKTALSDMLHPFAARLRGVNPHRAMLSLLSSKSYIGDVEISDKAQGFEPKASREGFVGEAGIGPLHEVIRFAIDWSTIYREYARGLAAKKEARQARNELETQLRHQVQPKEVVASAIRVVETEVRSLATQLPTVERQQVLRSLRTATEAIAKHEASSREELRHLQLVASTSTLLLIFSHEVKALLSWLEQVNISLDRVHRQLRGRDAERVVEIQNEFSANKQRFLDLLAMTSLISVGNRESEPTELTLQPRLERAVRCFDLIKNSYGIHIDISSVPGTLKVGPMLEAELYAVLLNVISNAIKSVIAAGKSKRIFVSALRMASKVTMHVLDSGIGLNEEHYEDVFAPFVSDPGNQLYRGLGEKLNPEDEYIIGTGSGLGLSIVREILSSRGGSIRFIPPNSEWNADLEIVLP
ncbi:MAG: histidine kinase [Phycisphaerales bacterium]|nr:histidine kinase [Phycisphaerales bacterium]